MRHWVSLFRIILASLLERLPDLARIIGVSKDTNYPSSKGNLIVEKIHNTIASTAFQQSERSFKNSLPIGEYGESKGANNAINHNTAVGKSF